MHRWHCHRSHALSGMHVAPVLWPHISNFPPVHTSVYNLILPPLLGPLDISPNKPSWLLGLLQVFPSALQHFPVCTRPLARWQDLWSHRRRSRVGDKVREATGVGNHVGLGRGQTFGFYWVTGLTEELWAQEDHDLPTPSGSLWLQSGTHCHGELRKGGAGQKAVGIL